MEISIPESTGKSGISRSARLALLFIAALLLVAFAVRKHNSQSGVRWYSPSLSDEEIRARLDAGADPNAASKYGWRPIADAARRRRFNVVKLLLDHGANDPAALGQALDSAAEAGNEELARNLIAHGLTTAETSNAVLHAAGSKQAPVLRLLLSHGADPNVCNGFGDSALMLAAGKSWSNGGPEAARVLLDGGAHIDFKRNDGATALTAAAMAGRSGDVHLLLSRGARKSLLDACLLDDLPTVRKFLNSGANPNFRIRFGDTPLAFAAEDGFVEVIHELVRAGANLETRNMIGETPLMKAASDGQTSAVRALIESGVSLSPINDKGHNALIIALLQGHLDTAQCLKQAGSDTDPESRYGRRAMTAFAFGGDLTMVKKLLEIGADPNRGGSFGRTALMAAAAAGHREIIDVLLASGADPAKQDSKGQRAADYAKDETIRELLTHAMGGR